MMRSDDHGDAAGLHGQAGLVFDLKRYAINDGPGIRLVIFLKGCNLHCIWCHNPEGLSAKQERMYHPSRCIGCGTCVEACPGKALTLTAEGIVTDAESCRMTGECAGVCPAKAIEMSGIPMSVESLMREITKEQIFFDQSGGGVTISGGEPLLHPDLLIPLLDACGKMGIHRAVDTAGLVSSRILLDVASRTDLFLYDLKLMDPERHRKWTGHPNGQILNNLRLLADTGASVIVRIPLIGGVNDDAANLSATARFVASLQGEKMRVHLLPYHKIAQSKYAKLGKPAAFTLLNEPDQASLAAAVEIFAASGIEVAIG